MAEIQGGNTHVAGRRPFVACCGTTGIDIAILSRQEIKLWEKNNDILVKMSCGGMMRNIAENLARLGVSAVLFSNEYGLLGRTASAAEMLAEWKGKKQ